MVRDLRRTYQLKIGLLGARPPIWRRVVVADTVKLPQLHDVIQIAMGWTNSHLHQFIADGKCYGQLDPHFDTPHLLDEDKVRLNQLLRDENQVIQYEYDFGDSWLHQITLEKILPFDPRQALPCCLKMMGQCPPEDVGGLPGFYQLLDTLNHPGHPEYQNALAWLMANNAPRRGGLRAVNEMLLEHCR